jgi:putative transposase
MRMIAEALEVSRSNLHEQLNEKQPAVPPVQSYSDSVILEDIKEIARSRPTYGYRRMTAYMNKKLRDAGLKTVNHKRVYRIMKAGNMLLARYGLKAVQSHDGQVHTLKSNTRWCSDSFSIQCFNGDSVHVAFTLDTCDREVISWVSSTVGMDGATIRDLMVESVEKRFNDGELPHRIQWLTDNGPCYTAHETVNLGRMMGFDVRTTPSYSPESNGMAEALVKTIKRDYVWFGDLRDAATVMGQLNGWFEDYNENAPHKALKMMSPREFIRTKLAG